MISNFLVCSSIFICIKSLQSMDAFDCFVKNNPNLAGLPKDVLNIIRSNYIELLEEEATEIIANRTKNILYIYLKEDIQHHGYNYSYLSNCRHSGEGEVSIPESYNIVNCAVKEQWFELGMLPPSLPILRLWRPETPEWLIQLRASRTSRTSKLKYDTQFVYCISQLKRFVGYFKQGDLSRVLQFGYNLGRLQEISEKPDHTIFWQPVERLFLAQDWIGLDAYIDTLQKRF